MKPELDLFQKQKFYAQYYGTKTFYSRKHNLIRSELSLTYPELSTFEGGYLLLRPISQITDEEAIELNNLVSPQFTDKAFLIGWFEKVLSNESHYKYNPIRWMEITYYLRSRGFAIPFMGYSVDELETAGWIKLKS